MRKQNDLHRSGDGLLRREFVRVGCLSALGLGTASLFTRQPGCAGETRAAAKAQACILIWLDGGPSHLDMFDLKPQAPAEVRGPFAPIDTAVPGVQICELMPHTARGFQQVALVRSVTSPLGEHNFGTHYLLTGYKPTPVLEYPSYGAVVAVQAQGDAILPRNVAIPDLRVGGAKFSGHGFLPADTGPFAVGGDPARPEFQVRNLDLYPGVNPARLERRRDFLRAVDRFAKQAEEAGEVLSNPVFEQAHRLVTSADAKQAFDLAAEPQRVRTRYGGRTIGQSCLLARRLVERGVPFVTVNNPGWDTHQDAYTRLKEGYTGAKVPVGLIPSLDQAFSALIEDLRERGLLESTLVVVMGEFGRTPKLNTSGGRDHWPRVFSVAMAGGGVRGGQVLGASDAVGESPHDHPVTPADLACTIYSQLGIDPQQLLHTSDGRPVAVNRDGTLLQQLVS